MHIHCMEPASSIIEKCGGPQVVADWLGIDVTRVYHWRRPKDRKGGTGGLIPPKHHWSLIQKAKIAGVKLGMADLQPDTPPQTDEAAA